MHNASSWEEEDLSDIFEKSAFAPRRRPPRSELQGEKESKVKVKG